MTSQPAKFAIVRSAYRSDIVNQLATGAKAVLDESGVLYDEIAVSGSLEIPAAVAMIANGPNQYDGVVVLGCLIKGATIHDEVIAYTIFPALDSIARQFSLPLGNGILTVGNEAQALERADPGRQNRGGEAAKAALWMRELKQAQLSKI